MWCVSLLQSHASTCEGVVPASSQPPAANQTPTQTAKPQEQQPSCDDPAPAGASPQEQTAGEEANQEAEHSGMGWSSRSVSPELLPMPMVTPTAVMAVVGAAAPPQAAATPVASSVPPSRDAFSALMNRKPAKPYTTGVAPSPRSQPQQGGGEEAASSTSQEQMEDPPTAGKRKAGGDVLARMMTAERNRRRKATFHVGWTAAATAAATEGEGECHSSAERGRKRDSEQETM